MAPTPTTLEIKSRKVSSLTQYERNTRTHSPGQIQQLCDTITEFGFNNPILIDEHEMIIAGHGRLAAAIKLGMDEVPTIQLLHLTKAQKIAYAIADNKIALNSGWNQDMLAMELASISAEDFSLEVTGFDFRELDAMKIFELAPGANGDIPTVDHDDGIIPLGAGREKGRPAKTNALVTFGSYKIGVSDQEMADLEGRLKEYENTYGLHQGFIGWLCDRG